ncbi:hypothetical protein G5C60_31045 [Streptomyces sp. HC44]|uniref:Uncharacterized protein n=1 Tax=Streptomyces scabichelini TaxID=2711217 RepID=A0A6G4VD77_9ACTN|nr:hypothetical protein [Streptomyces scabichelini]NGO11921.1 hypothetical protein [Streptomyces scabichelini]
MERAEHDIATELVNVADLSLDELLMRPSEDLGPSVRRILLQVELPEPLTASAIGTNC